jgi:hypothetical protein
MFEDQTRMGLNSAWRFSTAEAPLNGEGHVSWQVSEAPPARLKRGNRFSFLEYLNDCDASGLKTRRAANGCSAAQSRCAGLTGWGQEIISALADLLRSVKMSLGRMCGIRGSEWRFSSEKAIGHIIFKVWTFEDLWLREWRDSAFMTMSEG